MYAVASGSAGGPSSMPTPAAGPSTSGVVPPPAGASGPASGSAPADVYAQHDDLCRSLSSMYVANLKNVLKKIRSGPEGYGISISGNKADLVARIQQHLGTLKSRDIAASWTAVKQMILEENPRLLSRYETGASRSTYAPPPSYSGLLNQARRQEWAHGLPARPAMAPSSGPRPSGQVQFRPSPFYKVVSIAGQPTSCEPAGYAERKTKSIFFCLTAEQQVLLQSAPVPHELRFFCIAGSQYDNSLRTGTQVHVEFPQTCEVRVNGTQLSANLRGTKKSVCRSPPNLNKDKAIVAHSTNRVEFIYSNAPQRYTVLVALCLVTSAAVLAERLRTANMWTKETVLSKMNKAVDDDDIVSGEGTLSLKCPLSYMRIQTPCRSHMCTHQQCFDANSFFSMNEQTPNWICPVCSKKLVPEHLIVDGYFDDILKRVPESFESVISEPSGDWHTADGRFTLSGTARPVAPVVTMALLDDSDDDEKDPTLVSSSQPGVKGSHDPDPRTPLAHERNGSAAVDMTQTPSPKRSAANGINAPVTRPREIIDLTLDSDDEAPPPKRPRHDGDN